jgi:Protein kinase domain
MGRGWRPDAQKAGLRGRDINATTQALCNAWQELCAIYLPVAYSGSTWRFSRETNGSDPQQGWKIHLSAIVLTACEVMRRVAPYLKKRGVLFKAPASLQDLGRINCGLSHGYSQIGKFITIYPRSDREAVAVACRLHRLTRGLSAPAVPFDFQFRPGSCVYYRYGGFERLEIVTSDGRRVPAIRHPDGDLIPDCRESAMAKPDWVVNPFVGRRSWRKTKSPESPLKTTFRAFRALSQRGKGGVYQALDLSVDPPRLCVLKEGRRGGEVGWDGRDGAWRVRNEERVLKDLQAVGLAVPRIYSSFEVEGNYYLVTEYIAGESLQNELLARSKRLSISQVLSYGIRISTIIAKIHEAGWVWRDCKPSNLIRTKNGDLRPIDFEGACLVVQPDPLPWNTPEFSPPGRLEVAPEESRAPEDLYAIGATLYFLLTGRLLEAGNPTPIARLRPKVPRSVCVIISELLAPNPKQRPNAEIALAKLREALAEV